MGEGLKRAVAAAKATRKAAAARRVASYARAIEWMALNDDNGWVEDEKPIPSVTAALVADLFGRTDEDVIADLRRELRRRQRAA